MKTPKYILRALLTRERAARLLIQSDRVITEFCQKHGIDCEFVNLHAEIIGNPSMVLKETFEAIEKAT